MRVMNFIKNKTGKGIIRFFKTIIQHPVQNLFLLTFILIALLINVLNTHFSLIIGSDMKGYQFEIETFNSRFIDWTLLIILLLGCNSLLYKNGYLIILNLLITLVSLLIFDIYVSFISDVEIIYRTYCNDKVVLTRYKYHDIGFVGNRTNYDTFKQIKVAPGILKNTGEIVEGCSKIK